jgi:hypothetical protein
MTKTQTITARIAAAEKELVVRERAAAHLKSMQAILNRSAIERLYDQLTALHIERLEAGNA